MVGIVVVSHSADLARAAVDLALQMVNGPAPRIEIAAGTADERLGTDAARVAQAVEAADDGEGVVVIMDLGSAILSAELALELLPEPGIKTRLVPAAFVEGIFAAVISAAGGAQLDAVARDAEEALEAKAAQVDQAQLSQSQLPGDAVAGYQSPGDHCRDDRCQPGWHPCTTRGAHRPDPRILRCTGHYRHRSLGAGVGAQPYRLDVTRCPSG
jgi:phosphoenolpyruvate---glycerone phosphotransferase subunit DhaM